MGYCQDDLFYHTKRFAILETKQSLKSIGVIDFYDISVYIYGKRERKAAAD